MIGTEAHINQADGRGRIAASGGVLSIAQIEVGERYRTDLGDIAGLARSIESVGLLHPIVLTTDGRLVAGARRLAAVKELGWAEVPVRIVDDLGSALEFMRAERDENECRKDFTPREVFAIGRKLEKLGYGRTSCFPGGRRAIPPEPHERRL